MKDILLKIAILLIVGEIVFVCLYWDVILTNIQKNFWISIISFFRGVAAKFMLNMLQMGGWYILQTIAIDHLIEGAFSWSPLLKIRKIISSWASCKKEDFLATWNNSHRWQKRVIIAGFIPVLLFTIGFIFYIPATQKMGIKTIQKKGGAKILYFIGRQLTKIPLVVVAAAYLKVAWRKFSKAYITPVLEYKKEVKK